MQDTSSKIPANMALSPKARATSSSSILSETFAILGAPLHKYVTIPLDSNISIIPKKIMKLITYKSRSKVPLNIESNNYNKKKSKNLTDTS